MAKLKKYVPLNLMIAEVKKEKMLRKVKGIFHVCKWPEFDKNRGLSDNEIFIRNKFSMVSKQASSMIQDPVLKSIYGSSAKPWQSAFNVAFKEIYYGSFNFYNGGHLKKRINGISEHDVEWRDSMDF